MAKAKVYTKDQLKEAGISITNGDESITIRSAKHLKQLIDEGKLTIARQPIEYSADEDLSRMFKRINGYLASELTDDIDSYLNNFVADLNTGNKFYLTMDEFSRAFEGYVSSLPPRETESEKPAEERTETATETSTERTAESATETPADGGSENPTEGESEKPAEGGSEKPAEERSEPTTETSTERTADSATETPTDDGSEKPTEGESEKPTESGLEKPVEGTEEPKKETPKSGERKKVTKSKKYFRIVDGDSSFKELWDKYHENGKAILVLFGQTFKMEDYNSKSFEEFKNDIDAARTAWEALSPEERLTKYHDVDAEVGKLTIGTKKVSKTKPEKGREESGEPEHEGTEGEKPEKPAKGGSETPTKGGSEKPAEGGSEKPAESGSETPTKGGSEKPAEGGSEKPEKSKPAKPEKPEAPKPTKPVSIKGISPEKTKEFAGRRYEAVGKIQLNEKEVYNFMLKLMAIAEKEPRLVHLTAEINDIILTGRASYTDVISVLNKGMLVFYRENPDVDSKKYYDAVKEFNNATVKNDASRPVEPKEVDVDAPEGRKNLYETVVRKNNTVNDGLRKTLVAYKVMKEKDGILVPAKTKSADYATIADEMYSELKASSGDDFSNRVKIAMEYQKLNDSVSVAKKEYQAKKEALESGVYSSEEEKIALENQVQEAYQKFQVSCMYFKQFCDGTYENSSTMESHSNAYIAASTLGQIQAITIAESLAGRNAKDMYFGKPVLDNEPTRISNYRKYTKLYSAIQSASNEVKAAKESLNNAKVLDRGDEIEARKTILEEKKEALEDAKEDLAMFLESKSKITRSVFGSKSMKSEIAATEDAILSCELGKKCDISDKTKDGPRVDLALYSASRRMLLASLSEEEIGGISASAKKIKEKEAKAAERDGE